MLRTAVIIASAAAVLAVPPEPRATTAPWKTNIKNIVVLVEENRSFDEFVGGLSYSSDIDGLVNRQFCNPM